MEKSTCLIGNYSAIMLQFDYLRCKGGHVHYEMWGSSQMDTLKVWPWQLDERLTEGVIQLKRLLKKDDATSITNPAHSKPVLSEIAIDTADSAELAQSDKGKPWWRKCRGCIGNMAMTHQGRVQISRCAIGT